LKDFKEDVKNEKEKGKKSSKNSKDNNESEDESDFIGSCLSSIFAEILLKSVGLLFYYNGHIRHTKYPYAEDERNWSTAVDFNMRKYFNDAENNQDPKKTRDDFEVISMDEKKGTAIISYGDSYELISIEKIKEKQKEAENKKREENAKDNKPDYFHYYVNIYSAIEILDKNTYAYIGGMQSKFFGLIGPGFEYKQYKESEETLNQFRLSGDLSLVQIDGFSIDFRMGLSLFTDVSVPTGLCVGTYARFFLMKPFSLHFGYSMLKHDTLKFHDIEAKAGVLYNRYEFYVGYNYIGFSDVKLDGISVGFSLWI